MITQGVLKSLSLCDDSCLPVAVQETEKRDFVVVFFCFLEHDGKHNGCVRAFQILLT